MKEIIKQLKSRVQDDAETRDDVVDIARSAINTFIAATGTIDNDRMRKVLSYGSLVTTVGMSLWSIGSRMRRVVTHSNGFTVKIPEGDIAFEIVEDWIMAAVPPEKQRSTSVKYDFNRERRRAEMLGGYGSSPSDSSERQVDLIELYDGSIRIDIDVDGHKVGVYSEFDSEEGKVKSRNARQKTIVLECPTLEAKQAVLSEIAEAIKTLKVDSRSFYEATTWGDFSRRKGYHRRNLDTVILKEGQMDRIFDHIRTFHNNKEAYEKVGIPYRTGILLYGPPGSGKTSTAVAISTELDMDVYYISLSIVQKDEALSECFSEIPAGALVVLEDIDIASSVRERDSENGSGVTMQGILNCLDGMATPNGIITIMTTNRFDVLDPAVIRPGRVDLMEELGNLDKDQIERICQYYMGLVPDGIPEVTPEHGISSARLVGVFREYMPDFEKAADKVLEVLLSAFENKEIEELDKALERD